MWQRLVDYLALTSTERKVILFLAGSLLLGAGIRFYREAFPARRQFDYRTSDSTFASLSRNVLADSGATRHSGSSKTIDLNSATKQDLMRLSGIGEVMSGRILEYRVQVGSFHRIDDLLHVKGITKKRLEQMKNFITIDTVGLLREE
jgi:competence ComEA-like helix-hairpin-helix protein